MRDLTFLHKSSQKKTIKPDIWIMTGWALNSSRGFCLHSVLTQTQKHDVNSSERLVDTSPPSSAFLFCTFTSTDAQILTLSQLLFFFFSQSHLQPCFYSHLSLEETSSSVFSSLQIFPSPPSALHLHRWITIKGSEETKKTRSSWAQQWNKISEVVLAVHVRI